MKDRLELNGAFFINGDTRDDAEETPVCLARYGLMELEAFVAEMRERMGMDDKE
ncbi:hypothetical protein [Achromobacter xylosoxidans]|uniref:hypothetical protein n=1 Tax=Alcaligenes xylosoxydans xylosoxydans TaxID=85698 RepID=UPI0013F4C023|nr:hypothetical protein [Achromobacter xylosoxidans]